MARSRLVNVESGRTLTHQVSRTNTKDTTSTTGQAQGPGSQDVLGARIQEAAGEMVQRLSPRMGALEVVVAEDMESFAGANEDAAEEWFAKGVGWMEAEPPNLDRAYLMFQEAEQLARESSAGLNWNLAILYWSRGDLDEATRRFDLAERVSKASFMDKDKRAVRSRFDQVKNRLLLEQGVRGTSSNELRRATRRSFAQSFGIPLEQL